MISSDVNDVSGEGRVISPEAVVSPRARRLGAQLRVLRVARGLLGDSTRGRERVGGRGRVGGGGLGHAVGQPPAPEIARLPRDL